MGIIVFLVVGALVGWLASRIMGRDEGLLASIVIGIVGSMIGGFVSTLVTGSGSYLALDIGNFIWSLVGAIILVAILNSLSRRWA